MQTKSHLKPLRLWEQLITLFFIELTNWRWSWRLIIFMGTLTPLFLIFFLGIFARDSGAEPLGYILTGNIILSMLFSHMGLIQNRFIFMRFSGTLDYYATLPIQRILVFWALILSSFVLSLPTVLIVVVVGSAILKITLNLHPLILVVLPMSMFPLAGVGAIIGVSVRTLRGGESLNRFITLLLWGLGPVMLPPDRLPEVILFLSRLNPTCYAASAFQQTLLGPMKQDIVPDLVALGLFSGISFWVVRRNMQWRVEGKIVQG